MQTHSNSGIEKDGSPSVKLVLGYEEEGSGRHVKTEPKDTEEEEEEEESKCGFTEAQWHELYLQALIFKYIQCGLPVPFHLLLPIWRTLSTSFTSDSTVFFTQHFSGFRHLNAWGFGDMSMMDSEPGRCRRTDGKKWRCSKSIVPNEKYCERHMHRGSNRSRKLVEASQTESKSQINPARQYDRPLNLEAKPKKFLSSSATNNASVAAKASIALPSSGVNGHIDSPFSSLEANRFCTNNGKHNSLSVHGVGPNLLSTIAPFDSHNIRGRSDKIDGKYAMFNGVNTATETNQMSEKRNTCQSYVFVPGLGIFPKSGHEHGTGSSSSGIPQNRLAETELLRCNRSDGKKWRCKKASVPGHKYCEMHLHRGSKKITTPSNPVTVALPPPAMDRICPPLAIPTRYIDDGASLNTNLSIAPASHQLVNCDSVHTSSSDSTTITDETPTFVMH